MSIVLKFILEKSVKFISQVKLHWRLITARWNSLCVFGLPLTVNKEDLHSNKNFLAHINLFHATVSLFIPWNYQKIQKFCDVCLWVVNLSIKSNLFYSFLLFIDDLIKSGFLSWKIIKFDGTNFCGCSIFRDLGPKSRKLIPQIFVPRKFLPAEISAFKVVAGNELRCFNL